MKGTKTKAWHIAFLMLADVVSVLLAMLIAYLMTVGDKSFSLWLVWWALGNIACTLLFFGLFGMYGIVFSTVGIIDALKQTLAIVGVASANVIFAVLTGRAYVGISTALVYSIFLFYFSVMTRFFKRILIVVRYYLSRTKVNRKRVMIVGGGAAGSGEAGTPCGRPGAGLHVLRQLFQQALRQAVHFGKIHRPNVVLLQLIVPPVRLGNGQLRLPQQCRGCLLQKADAYPPGFYGAAIIGKTLSVDGPARQRYPVQAVAGHKGQPRFRDQQMIQLFGGEGTGAADDMVPPCHCFIP